MIEVQVYSDEAPRKQMGAFSIRQALLDMTDEQIGSFIRQKIQEAIEAGKSE